MALSAEDGDLRLHNVAMPNWQKGAKQALLGTSYKIVEPTVKIPQIPSQVDFDIPRDDHLLFGPMTKFRIKGTFQMKAAGENQDWTKIPVAEYEKVLLAPNWFDMLVKEATVFHDNTKVSSSSELRYVTPFLNAYLLHNMDRLAKKMLCPQPAHPAFCLPKPADSSWTIDSAQWKNYAAAAFGSTISFDMTPLFLFPFFQGPNYLIDGDVPRILPVPSMGRIQVRFAFTDSQDHIFRKKTPATNTATYRFVFSEFSLVLEEARLSTNFDRQLKTSKKHLAFPGVTRLQLIEPVADSSTTFRTKFQDIYMPEALFIFCLNKTVASGTYKFSTGTETTVFAQHNIMSIDMSFDNRRFSAGEPHIGTFLEDKLDSKSLFDKLGTPPFGIRQDASQLTHSIVEDGAKNTAFPHVYISLMTGPDRQRLVPYNDDGSCINKRADLELDIKFTDANSPANAVYVIYAIWTDVNVVYDPKSRTFASPYLQYMN